jgi:hypothetical protein
MAPGIVAYLVLEVSRRDALPAASIAKVGRRLQRRVIVLQPRVCAQLHPRYHDINSCFSFIRCLVLWGFVAARTRANVFVSLAHVSVPSQHRCFSC